MRKMYSSAPLPFVGQKRMSVKEFIKALGQAGQHRVCGPVWRLGPAAAYYQMRQSDATVVYNDFDNYRCRLANIPATNVLLSDLRRMDS